MEAGKEDSQFGVFKVSLSSPQEDAHYLQQNVASVKEKIRDKLLRHRIDFADRSSSHYWSQQEKADFRDIKVDRNRERVHRYNHDFEERQIRKRISIRQSHTEPAEQTARPLLDLGGPTNKSYQFEQTKNHQLEQADRSVPV